MDEDTPSAPLIDWRVACATGLRLLPPPPQASAGEIEAVVAQLRRFAAESRKHVAEFTHLTYPDPEPPVLVVDRARWLTINVEAFAELSTPLLVKLADARTGPTSGALRGVGARITGLELGALLAFVGSKVLGQYEPFLPVAATGQPGRLLLVAPNIVHVERELRVDPADFRMWVCLHEETHRTQFTAVPWLREHVRAEMAAFLDATDVDPAAMLRQIQRALTGMGQVVRGGGSLVEVIATPQQRAVLDRITAVMSLLEGHADYVMDGIGPDVIPSVTAIRAAFTRRRQSATGLDALLRRLLGLEAKMRQYRDGEIFVRGVVSRVGMTGFNRVWESPATLPSLMELHDPDAWVERVHGRPTLPSARGSVD
ncbi:MAG: zinc-dependent metalloprotease [Sporichthyaceae bacterium]